MIYSFFVIGKIEDNQIFGYCLGASIFLGLVGGYWDVIELNLQYNQQQIVNIVALSLGILGISYILYHQYKGR